MNKNKNIDAQYAFLQDQMAKACFSKYGLVVNNKRINKLASQMRYLEKMIRPEVKEEK